MSQINMTLDVSKPVVLVSKEFLDREEWRKVGLKAKTILAGVFTLFMSVLACGFLVMAQIANHDRNFLLDQLQISKEQLREAESNVKEIHAAYSNLQRLTRFQPNDKDNIKWHLSIAEITAYTPCDNPMNEPPYACDGVTASGMVADHSLDIIAVNPLKIPFRSNVWIPGVGWKQAMDKICDKRCREVTNSIDILVATRREAFKWGRRKDLPVIVVPPPA